MERAALRPSVVKRGARKPPHEACAREMNENLTAVCDECGSEFSTNSSKMSSLCPECAHYLYGYPNCRHVFKNGRCVRCGWDGSENDYIKRLKK